MNLRQLSGFCEVNDGLAGESLGLALIGVPHKAKNVSKAVLILFKYVYSCPSKNVSKQKDFYLSF